MFKKLSKIIVFVLILAFLMTMFTSCGPKKVTHDESEYILELPYKDGFKILQLSDIHLANKDNQDYQMKFLDLTISEADADLIVLSGDTFTFADKKTAKRLFAFLDSYGTPWTLTFGNHDEQCYFSVSWLTNYLNNYGSNCIFKDIQDDDVFGYANFAINLMENGKAKEQVIVMDSNRYNYGEYIGYDYFKEDQIEWYERIVKYTIRENEKKVPSILICHIPVPEFKDAWEKANNGDEDAILEYGELNESPSVPKINSGFFDVIEKLGSTNAILVGHDHVNNTRILYKGIYLIYGVNSTNRIYYKDGMLGGHVVTINSDGSYEFSQIYHDYSEVK